MTREPLVEVSTENIQQTEEREESGSILSKKNKSPLTKDKKKSVDKKIIKEAKVAPVVEKKAKDSSSPFKYSNQNKSKFFTR